MRLAVVFIALAIAAAPAHADASKQTTKTLGPSRVTKEAKLAAIEADIAAVEASLAELDAAVEKMSDHRDRLGDLTEEQQLRMQMYMERLTKADAMMSNAQKKFSETASQIISNQK